MQYERTINQSNQAVSKPLRTKCAGLVAASVAALSATIILAACGGGGGVEAPRTAATSIKVFGDSIADSGVFGFKFTVNAAAGATTLIWTERIAAQYGKEICPFFRATGPASFGAPVATCGSFAIGGGRINNPAANGGATAPYSIPYQMDVATAAGNFAAADIILVDGGGNDAADLFGAYLQAADPAKVPAYVALLTTILPAATVTAALGQPNGSAIVGGAYMQALANRFADAISTKILAKGGERVVVLNMPAITNTPRFKAVLGGVAAASGGGAAGAATAAAAEGLAKSWVEAFNAQLAIRLGPESKVVIVDFYTEFNNQVANPAQYGLTSVTTPVCPIVGVDSSGLPAYNFPACTTTLLDASGPTGWRNYAFSDGFHPTPRGYEILADLVAVAMGRKGWL